jgi:hypothetical protein
LKKLITKKGWWRGLRVETLSSNSSTHPKRGNGNSLKKKKIQEGFKNISSKALLNILS